MQRPREAIVNRKNRRNLNNGSVQSNIEDEDYSKIDKEKIASYVLGVEASVTAWMNQERTKMNAFLRKKGAGITDSLEKNEK